MTKFVHICPGENKFIPKFINFIDQNFNREDCFFIIVGRSKDLRENKDKNIIYINGIKLISLTIFMKTLKAEKIFFHSLTKTTEILLFFHPWFLKKCYWIIWSGDLYYYLSREKIF